MDMKDLSTAEIKALQQALTPKMTKYIKGTPTPKQAAAMLMNTTRELLYGGAASGGKSWLLLAAALQYVDTPGYAAIIFRKTFSDLSLPGALIPKSQEWLSPFIDSGQVLWNDKAKRYTFLESGATLTFGYLDTQGDHFRYQGAEFQAIFFDECTHIIPESYIYMFSRLRRLKGVDIPLRIRAACNPGGVFGEWYYNRFFVDNKDEDGNLKRIFLQAGMHDNPYVDVEEYKMALAELDPITREQLENGNWEIRAKGDLFEKNWLLTIEYDGIPDYAKRVRFWDLASIDPKYRKKNTNTKEPDWTVGLKMASAHGVYYIEDIVRVQKAPGDIEKIIKDTALADGYGCAIRMEQEGGASGEANTQHYAREVLQGFDFQGVKPVSSKIERSRPVAAAMQSGNVFISNRCRNLLSFFAELEAFPNGVHDDTVDTASGAFSYFKPALHVCAPGGRAFKRKVIQTTCDDKRTNDYSRGSVWLNDMRR